jgi:predicted permease
MGGGILRFFERLWHDVRFGARVFRKSPGLSAVALLSLALGIGVNTAIFSLVNVVLLRPLPAEAPEQLVYVYTTDRNSPGSLENSHLNYVDFRERSQVFSGLMDYTTIPLSFDHAGQTERVTGQLVSGNYFDVLGVRPALGRTFLPEEDRTPGASPVAVVSHNFWTRRMNADPEPVGKVIKLNDHPFTVVGVAPRSFTGVDLSVVPEVWLPQMMFHEAAPGTETRYTNRRFLFLSVVGRLRPGGSLGQAQDALSALASQLAEAYPNDNAGRGVKLVPLSEVRLNPDGNNVLFRISVLLLSIVGTILLIACVNVANLLLARATSRRKEIAIRLALGSSRARLVTQLLTEALLLSTAGGLLGLGLAYLTKDLLRVLIPPSFQMEGVGIALDARVLLVTLALSVASGLLFGLFPGLQASRPELVSTLKSDIMAVEGRAAAFTLRKALIVAEVSLCVVTLVVATLFLRSLSNARQIDPGFKADNVLLAAVDISLKNYDEAKAEAYARQFYPQLVERVGSLPGVEQAVISRSRPFEKGFSRSVFIEGAENPDDQRGVLVRANIVGAGYFKTLGIPVLSGREFADTDRADTPTVVIVNEAMARRFWPNQDAVGKRLKLIKDPAAREVVGVVRNTKVNSLTEQDQPYLYLPLSQHYTPTATVYARTTSAPEQFTAAVRREVQTLDPSLPVFDVRTLREQTDRSLWAERSTARLLTLFGLLALLLAASGIFGIVSYFISQRTRDIGIRLALGAQPAAVIRLVMGEVLVLVGLGVVLGVGATLALTHLLRSLLYGISPTDLFAFISAPAVLFAVALLASFLPARRAAKIDPLRTLRAQ